MRSIAIMYHRLLLFIILLSATLEIAAQKTTTVVPSKEYNRSGYHNFFWGSHYRKEWNTAVQVNNFYLDTAFGGLTPSAEGGSRQSKTLRLKAKNGKEYVLRSVDKDFGRGVAPIYQGTWISRIAKDQASIGYPYAAITITPMIDAAGIYHTNPRIVYLPKQSSLGKFNEKYGDELYLLEERADENQEDVASFGYAKNVIGTPKLLDKLYKDNDNQVDQKAYARARLFDMFIGDWSRHADQWRWAEFEEGKKSTYRPIPRDRDQAYTKIDGLYPDLIATTGKFKHIQGFKHDIKNVGQWNYPARRLDQQFTNELSEEDWVSIARELQVALTDELIEKSMRLVPANMYEISGDKIVARLKSRRDHLEEYAREYYKYLAKKAFILGSNERELFEINRLNNNETQINVYKINKENEVKKDPIYSRTFKRGETKAITIYGLDKTDVYTVNGDQRDGVRTVIVDVEDKDSFTTAARGKTKVYSGDHFEMDTSFKKKKFRFSILPLMSPKEYSVFNNDYDPMNQFTRTGVRVSANIFYDPQPWRTEEKVNHHVISANYGFLRGTFNAGYIGRFGNTIGSFDLLLKARVDWPAVENFYGIGNETFSDKDADTRFYRVESRRFYGAMGLDKQTDYHYFNLSGFYQRIELRPSESFGAASVSLPESIDPGMPQQYGGATGQYRFRKTSKGLLPMSGIDFTIAGGYFDNLDQREGTFRNVASSVAVYIPLGKSFSIATRVGGASLDGDAPFYYLNKLSGNENLRGYPRERFNGKTSFYNNNELRFVTNTRNFFFNGQIGLLAFYDHGRLWQPLEKSSKWHAGYGGGIIVAPFNKVAINFTYGKTEEGSNLQIRTGYFF